MLRDDGEGISPSNRDRIFDPFFTTRRDSGGTGMGLAIVLALLRAHGGTISLADTDGGAAFAVTLPVARSSWGGRGEVAQARSRTSWLIAVAGVMVAGLVLRYFGPMWGLPFGVTKYGGSMLWGAMVYGLVASIRPKMGRERTAGVAFMIAVLVEVSRLIHTPALDMFRESTAGALLLGRVFSPWNLLAYGFGMLFGLMLDLPLASDPARGR